MKKPLMKTAAMILATGVLLAGCGGGSVPRDHYYRLAAAQVPMREGGPLPGGVEVAPFRADGLLNDRSIMFHSGASTIEGYSYHFWWQSPGTMIQQNLIDALRSAQAFQVVAGPEMHISRSYDVTGRIRRLEQGAGAVTVEFEVSLRLARGGPPLLLKTYSVDVPTADESVDSAVKAFSTATGQIWTRFIADLATITPVGAP